MERELAPIKCDFPVEDYHLYIDETYLNNPHVKRAYIKKQFSPEQAKEIVKCMMDPIYFSKCYVKIRTTDGDLVNFVPYEYQEAMIRSMMLNRFLAALLARQAGKTTVVSSFILWFALFNDNKDIAILANKGDQAQEIISRIQLSYENLPFFLQQGVRVWNKRSIVFENGSRIFSASTSSSSIRGRACALVYIDEAAHIENDFEFYESTYPVISAGKQSRVIMTTTPKGARGMFYKIFTEAMEGLNTFVPFKAIWSDVPGRDDKWEKETRENTSDSQFEQEFNVKFLGSSGTLIPNKILEQLVFRNPIKETDTMKIYEKPDENKIYFAVVDCAEGLELDYSVITVFDVTQIPYKIVAKYRSNTISPLLLPYTIVSVCEEYNKCPVLVESNNDVGGQVTYILYYELEYENVILTATDTKGRGAKASGRKAKPGVKTTKKIKNTGCSNLKTMIENEKLDIVDDDTILELGTFIRKEESYEADSGCTDDCVMTLVLFAWFCKQEFFDEYTSSDFQKSIFDSGVEQMMEDILPFGFHVTGIEESPYEQIYQHGDITVYEGSATTMEEWMRS